MAKSISHDVNFARAHFCGNSLAISDGETASVIQTQVN